MDDTLEESVGADVPEGASSRNSEITSYLNEKNVRTGTQLEEGATYSRTELSKEENPVQSIEISNSLLTDLISNNNDNNGKEQCQDADKSFSNNILKERNSMRDCYRNEGDYNIDDDVVRQTETDSQFSPGESEDPPRTEKLEEHDINVRDKSPEDKNSASHSHSENFETDAEMGRKSGSFSKKNGGLYVYSKDEFRESYQNSSKPKAAPRSLRLPRGKAPNIAKSPKRHTADFVPQSPGADCSVAGSSSSEIPEVSARSSPSGYKQDGHQRRAAAEEKKSSQPHVTVELLQSGQRSPINSPPATIDHSFVVTSDQESTQSAKPLQGSGLESAANGTVTPAVPARLESAANGTVTPVPAGLESAANGTVRPAVPARLESAANGTITPVPGQLESAANGTVTPVTAGLESAANGTVRPAVPVRLESAANGRVRPVPAGLESAANGTVTPVPAPRASVRKSTSAPTMTTNDVDADRDQRDEEGPESRVPISPRSPHDFKLSRHPVPTPKVISPRMPKSPDPYEIMCITRTVDGEEELILGAGPMFANQEKLAMESAMEQNFSGSISAQNSGSSPVESATMGTKGFKNYACIEPVGQPVEPQLVVNSVGDTETDPKQREVQGSSTAPSGEMDVGVADAKLPATAFAGGDDDDEDDDDDDEDEGVDNAAYLLNDWVYRGTKEEINLVNGTQQADAKLDPEDVEDLKMSTEMSDATSMDSVETTSSEKNFKDQYSSFSLRKVKREGSVLGYRKLTDITRERKVIINFDEKVQSFGFRIQYSKPAIVTEIDAGGAAEKKGLLVGDVVLGVNGTDVKNAPHATVVKLVRDGPSELHLLVGTNMCNSPNQDLFKPIKTGYMHKLGGQGMLKNWKKRWFVLKHDGCLYYYKTQEDVDPLGAVVLTNYTLVRARDAGKSHSFKITKYKARTYYFYTENESEMSSWAKAITEAAQKKTNADVWLDISTHNVGLPAYSIKNPDCRGVLTKQGNAHKNWKKRYCVLKDACLYYYKDVKQPQALGIAHFHGYTIQEKELAGKKYGFVLVPPISDLRTYFFIADNETERKRWVASLASSIGRWIQTNEEDEFSQAEVTKDNEMLI